MTTLGMSQFARDRHYSPDGGNTYTTTLPETELIKAVLSEWHNAMPGHGERDLSRKVVVPLPLAYLSYFVVPFVPLSPDLPVRARVSQRQKGEDYYVETYIDYYDSLRLDIRPPIASAVDVVCYHRDALVENGGERSTDKDWEIVAILGRVGGDNPEPMRPLTMARNYLQLAGGTFTDYTPRQFAEAIIFWSANKGIRIMHEED